MEISKVKFIEGFIRVCSDGYAQGWHERNGGNLSYRLSNEDVKEVQSELVTNSDWFDIGMTVLELKNEYFLITGSGKYFRNVELNPELNIGIIRISETGDKYQIQWGLIDGGKPTSELPAHLMNHEVKKRENENYRVIYHAHTTNIIALTFVLPLKDEIFTRELWEMATECPVVFPNGVGVVPWMVPGGEEIALVSSKLMEKYDVIVWAHHGTFCSGENFDSTFGLMHTVEKAAEILVKVFSMSNKKLQTIQPNEFKELAEAFRVELPEEFLYKK